MASPSVLYGTSRATLNGTFGGMNPNSGWTLFIADVAAGGGQSQITSWGLAIDVVPEPGTMALGGLALAGFVARRALARSAVPRLNSNGTAGAEQRRREEAAGRARGRAPGDVGVLGPVTPEGRRRLSPPAHRDVTIKLTPNEF